MPFSLSSECAALLAKTSLLGALAGAGESWERAGGKPLAFDQGRDLLALRNNGVERLLTEIPFGATFMSSLGQDALLAALLSSIKGSFHLSLTDPLQASELAEAIRRRISGKNFSASPFPGLNIGAREAMGILQLGHAADILKRNLNIDLFGRAEGTRLRAFLQSRSTKAAASRLSGAILPSRLLAGLRKLTTAASLSHMRKSLGIGGHLPVTGHLASPHLQPLWRGIAEGRLGRFVHLPDPKAIAAWNLRKAAILDLERMTGSSAASPEFGLRVSGLSAAFRANNICEILHGSGIAGSRLQGATQLLSFSSGIDRLRETAGVRDLTEQTGGKSLAKAIQRLVEESGKQPPASGGGSEFVQPLKRLADLGTAVS